MFITKDKFLNIGRLFNVNGQHDWMNSHAQVPTVLCKREEGIVRVYFSSRPTQNLSLTTFIDLSYENPREQIYLNPQPILPTGKSGMFDEHGIMPSSAVDNNGEVFLYYSGWSRGTSLPYANFTGLAISEDGGRTFRKVGPGPIIDRTYWGPYSATSPHVLKLNNQWYMFYCSGVEWIEIDGKLEHTYDIKIAQSHNGINWEQTGKVAIPQKNKFEAITRPTIYFDGEIFHMWFCYRGSQSFRDGVNSYKIGYAKSQNLFDWERVDDNFINSGDHLWDSKMNAYPDVKKIGSQLWIFYNGNNFGKEGFGAVSFNLT